MARREQFELLYRANLRPLLAYALRRASHPSEAADIVAEAMLVAWRRLDSLPDGDEARLWLYGVARRVAANQRRGVARRNRLGDRFRSELRQQAILPDHGASIAITMAVGDAVAELDETDQEILRLTAWEGLSPQEIAVVLAIPPATARTRLHRARERLGRQLRMHGVAREEHSSRSGHVDHDEHPIVRQPEDQR